MILAGSPYPITRHPRGFFFSQKGIDQVRSDLLILLMTNPGERVMLPEYGTPLRELMFEPNDEIIQEQALEAIINSITAWEPRITVTDIEVLISPNRELLSMEETGEGLEHALSIRIVFVDPGNIQDLQELKLEIPLS